MEFATLPIACESRFQICLLERVLIFSRTSILLLFSYPYRCFLTSISTIPFSLQSFFTSLSPFSLSFFRKKKFFSSGYLLSLARITRTCDIIMCTVSPVPAHIPPYIKKYVLQHPYRSAS